MRAVGRGFEPVYQFPCCFGDDVSQQQVNLIPFPNYSFIWTPHHIIMHVVETSRAHHVPGRVRERLGFPRGCGPHYILNNF